MDQIAKANKGRPDDPMRIEGCIWYCMEQDMQEGHLYQDKQQLQKKAYGQLNKGYQREAVTEMAVYKVHIEQYFLYGCLSCPRAAGDDADRMAERLPDALLLFRGKAESSR